MIKRAAEVLIGLDSKIFSGFNRDYFPHFEIFGTSKNDMGWNSHQSFGTSWDEKICKQNLFTLLSSWDTAVCLHFGPKFQNDLEHLKRVPSENFYYFLLPKVVFSG